MYTWLRDRTPPEKIEELDFMLERPIEGRSNRATPRQSNRSVHDDTRDFLAAAGIQMKD